MGKKWTPPDVIGKKYGKLTIKDVWYHQPVDGKQGRSMAICSCSCGVKKQIRLASVLGGHTASCGCGAPKEGKKRRLTDKYAKIKAGDRFWFWKILRVITDQTHVKKNRRLMFEAECVCGLKKIVNGYNVYHGKNKSCGCQAKVLRRQTVLKDYLAKTAVGINPGEKIVASMPHNKTMLYVACTDYWVEPNMKESVFLRKKLEMFENTKRFLEL